MEKNCWPLSEMESGSVVADGFTGTGHTMDVRVMLVGTVYGGSPTAHRLWLIARPATSASSAKKGAAAASPPSSARPRRSAAAATGSKEIVSSVPPVTGPPASTWPAAVSARS